FQANRCESFYKNHARTGAAATLKRTLAPELFATLLCCLRWRLGRLLCLPPSLKGVGALHLALALTPQSLHVPGHVIRVHRFAQNIGRLIVIGVRGRVSRLQAWE